MGPSAPPVALPRDATLIELRADTLIFETRKCLLPGTPVALTLVMEGKPLPIVGVAEACLVVARDCGAYLFHSRLSLAAVPEADRTLINLFIARGRGAPDLAPPPPPR